MYNRKFHIYFLVFFVSSWFLNFIFWRFLYMNTSSAQFSPFLLLFNSSHVPSLILKFRVSSIIIVTSTYLCVYVSLYNLWSPFGVSHMYMSPELTTWNWTTYVGVPPWRKLSLPFSAVNGNLDIALHLGAGPCGISLSTVLCQLGIVIMLILFR